MRRSKRLGPEGGGEVEEEEEEEELQRVFVDNEIRTSKYNLITFFPRNLFEQFRRVRRRR